MLDDVVAVGQTVSNYWNLKEGWPLHLLQLKQLQMKAPEVQAIEEEIKIVIRCDGYSFFSPPSISDRFYSRIG